MCMSRCKFCRREGCSDKQQGCPERNTKIKVFKQVGSKAIQDEIPKRLLGYLRKYSAYSLGITSDVQRLIEMDEVQSEYRKLYILWKGKDPAGIARLWGSRVKQIREYKTFAKKLVSTGPTELGLESNGEFSLYLLIR